MNQIWNRDTKRISAIVGTGIVAWYSASIGISAIPFPSFVAQPFMGPISFVTIAAGFALYGIYQLSSY